MADIQFGDELEHVITRDEWPLEKALEYLRDETIAIIGYGVQGPGQALNLKDNGFNVIVGQRRGGKTWDKAVSDGWVEGETLFDIEEAVKRGTIIQYLLSDAGQIAQWDAVKKHLNTGKCLYFSHGFAITFSEDTGVIPPEGIDVVLVAPKGSGTSLRRLFLEGKGLNSSYAIHQDATGRAKERVVSLGERGILMGAIAGVFEAQFNCLRSRGHSPSEAFNETVEELTQSLMPLVAENGMDWMYANTSTTAQRGALDWRHKFRDTVAPLFEQLYDSVECGNEARIVIESCSAADYRDRLETELAAMANEEIWRAGSAVRKLRPEASEN